MAGDDRSYYKRIIAVHSFCIIASIVLLAVRILKGNSILDRILAIVTFALIIFCASQIVLMCKRLGSINKRSKEQKEERIKRYKQVLGKKFQEIWPGFFGLLLIVLLSILDASIGFTKRMRQPYAGLTGMLIIFVPTLITVKIEQYRGNMPKFGGYEKIVKKEGVKVYAVKDGYDPDSSHCIAYSFPTDKYMICRRIEPFIRQEMKGIFKILQRNEYKNEKNGYVEVLKVKLVSGWTKNKDIAVEKMGARTILLGTYDGYITIDGVRMDEITPPKTGRWDK